MVAVRGNFVAAPFGRGLSLAAGAAQLSANPLGGEEHEHQRATFAVSRTEIG
jgi:hypothetical protein